MSVADYGRTATISKKFRHSSVQNISYPFLKNSDIIAEKETVFLVSLIDQGGRLCLHSHCLTCFW